MAQLVPISREITNLTTVRQVLRQQGPARGFRGKNIKGFWEKKKVDGRI
jgi:hypothetical protein